MWISSEVNIFKFIILYSHNNNKNLLAGYDFRFLFTYLFSYEKSKLTLFFQTSKKPKPNNWKSKHEEFIAAIRYAKMAGKVEKEGGKI